MGDRLSADLRTTLAAARARLARVAHVDERLLMPAARRYDGHLYRAARRIFDGSAVEQVDLVILSGGYGLVLPGEGIGWYDRAFRRTDWPPDLLESALVQLAAPHGQVVAFCARTTSYAECLRGVDWRRQGITCHLVSPSIPGRGGAQRIVPRTIGQALDAYLAGTLDAAWSGSDGLGLTVEVWR